jgi:uncharacterized heparinase superfamily protein
VFLNQERAIQGWNDSDIPKLWLYNLHYFDHPQCDLIERWILENPIGQGNGWEPYPLALRIVNWIKWALSGGDLSANGVRSLHRQADFLSQSLERHLGANHLFAGLTALVAAGLFFDSAKAQRWLDEGCEMLHRELSEQVLSDGGHFERSPMYHALILENLLDLVNLERTFYAGLADVHRWSQKAADMLCWLSQMSHPDGRIAFFNDAAFAIAPEPSELTSYATRLGIESNAHLPLGASGYRRLANNDATLLFDAAPVGPDYQPGHAHADTLSFELSLKGARALVNSGTSTYEKSAERQWQRGTAAHNTVRIDGLDQSEMWGAFRVARRARPFDIRSDGQTFVEAAHDGYRRLAKPVVHRRRLEFKKDLLIYDSIEGRGRHQVDVFFHFHPETEPEILLDSKLHRQTHESRWYPQFNRAVRNQTVVGSWTGTCPAEFLTVIPLRGRL